MKDLIILYAPTILTVVSALTAFIKMGSALKSQKKEIVDSAEMKELKKEMKNMCTEIDCLRKQLGEYHDSSNKEIQE